MITVRIAVLLMTGLMPPTDDSGLRRKAEAAYAELWDDRRPLPGFPSRAREIRTMHRKVALGPPSQIDISRESTILGQWKSFGIVRSPATYRRATCRNDVCELIVVFRQSMSVPRTNEVSAKMGKTLSKICPAKTCEATLLHSSGKGEWKGLALLGYSRY